MSDIVVETTSGRVRGSTVSGVHVFKGIPYGGSPAGSGRFRPARPPRPWAGVRDALSYGPTAPQLRPAEAAGSPPDPAAAARMAPFLEFLHGLAGDEPDQDEDCLVLNVWTGGTDQQRRRAVLVWLHGGAFSTGSGSWPLYDGASLASRGDAVVVTVNHRLGPLGFLHLGELADDRYRDSGNAAFVTDRVMWWGAIDWAQRKVAAGGAPVYVYRFDFATPALGGVLGATHGGEIPFMFDNYRLTPMAGDRPENAEVARTISEAFVRFAQEGDPSHASMPAWSPYSLGERATMIFNATPRAENDPRPAIRRPYAEICAGS
jgi:carboxylesterase type B